MKHIEQYWDTFFASGKVEDYLSVKEEERRQDIRNKHDIGLADEIRYHQMKASVDEHEGIY